jgi:hypothetical protein
MPIASKKILRTIVTPHFTLRKKIQLGFFRKSRILEKTCPAAAPKRCGLITALFRPNTLQSGKQL